jgi:hypothetical protein
MSDRQLISNSINAVLCWHHRDSERLRKCLKNGYCDFYPIGTSHPKWNKLIKVGDMVQFCVKRQIVAVGIIQSEPYDLSEKRKIQPVDKKWPGAVNIGNIRFIDEGRTCSFPPGLGSHRIKERK